MKPRHSGLVKVRVKGARRKRSADEAGTRDRIRDRVKGRVKGKRGSRKGDEKEIKLGTWRVDLEVDVRVGNGVWRWWRVRLGVVVAIAGVVCGWGAFGLTR